MEKCSLSVTVTLVLVCIFIIAYSAALVSGLGGKVGGRTKVNDVKMNKEVQELGRYSVNEFNRQQIQNCGGGYGGDMKFQKVVEVETQVVSGFKYYLKIATVTAGGVPKMFDTKVVVQPLKKSKGVIELRTICYIIEE